MNKLCEKIVFFSQGLEKFKLLQLTFHLDKGHDNAWAKTLFALKESASSPISFGLSEFMNVRRQFQNWIGISKWRGKSKVVSMLKFQEENKDKIISFPDSTNPTMKKFLTIPLS